MNIIVFIIYFSKLQRIVLVVVLWSWCIKNVYIFHNGAVYCSEPQGMCYIETSNLDGETNLKIRQVIFAPPPPPPISCILLLILYNSANCLLVWIVLLYAFPLYSGSADHCGQKGHWQSNAYLWTDGMWASQQTPVWVCGQYSPGWTQVWENQKTECEALKVKFGLRRMKEKPKQ